MDNLRIILPNKTGKVKHLFYSDTSRLFGFFTTAICGDLRREYYNHRLLFPGSSAQN